MVCKIRPQKEHHNSTCITIGDNHICYSGDVGIPTSYLELVKLIINSVMTRKVAHYDNFDIKNFCLVTLLHRPEYVKVQLSDIPQEFIDEYDLKNCTQYVWVYFEICKVVNGFPQSGILAKNILRKRFCIEWGSHHLHPLATQVAPHPVLLNSQWFWHWVCGVTPRQTPPIHSGRTLHHHNWMGKKEVCWYWPSLELPITLLISQSYNKQTIC